MAMDAAEAARFKALDTELVELWNDIDNVVKWGKIATAKASKFSLNKTNNVSLEKTRKSALSPTDEKLIEQHIYSLKVMVGKAGPLRDEMHKLISEKNVPTKYDSIADYGKKFTKIFINGDAILKMAPEFLKSLQINGKDVYAFFEDYDNVAVRRFIPLFNDFCGRYPIVKKALTSLPPAWRAGEKPR
jgi:hypothetical protein